MDKNTIVRVILESQVNQRRSPYELQYAMISKKTLIYWYITSYMATGQKSEAPNFEIRKKLAANNGDNI